ncbi:hypothetical protein [Streptomyces agglomeratus]|uniref:hypothetical protein n=1 Tax=Streptomyces agglomeratus TaxID=285458 RepID=UPI00114C9728|nr:hypothetical protein [Streptomyces agglomeratus]
MDPVVSAFVALAASATVKQLVRGESPSSEDWGGIAGQVVDILLTQSSSQNTALERVEQQLGRIEQQLSVQPANRYEEYMAAGRRQLRDLHPEWRTSRERDDIIRDARTQFVNAVGVAEVQKDIRRQTMAEIAVAGCWLWVPSLPDVEHTLRTARLELANAVRTGAGSDAVRAYSDILRLAKAYHEVGDEYGIPIDPVTVIPALTSRPGSPVVMAMRTEPGRWIRCLGVRMRVGPASRPSDPLRRVTTVKVEVVNVYHPWIEVDLGGPTLGRTNTRRIRTGEALVDVFQAFQIESTPQLAINVRIPALSDIQFRGPTNGVLASLVTPVLAFLVRDPTPTQRRMSGPLGDVPYRLTRPPTPKYTLTRPPPPKSWQERWEDFRRRFFGP